MFEYHLGNRSTLEWVIDQYRVSPETLRPINSLPPIL